MATEECVVYRSVGNNNFAWCLQKDWEAWARATKNDPVRRQFELVATGLTVEQAEKMVWLTRENT